MRICDEAGNLHVFVLLNEIIQQNTASNSCFGLARFSHAVEMHSLSWLDIFGDSSESDHKKGMNASPPLPLLLLVFQSVSRRAG